MSIYFLDESDEPRECLCRAHDEVGHTADPQCQNCHGSGRLGGDGPRVEVRECDPIGPSRWRWRKAGLRHIGWSTSYRTETAALEAAREAHRNA